MRSTDRTAVCEGTSIRRYDISYVESPWCGTYDRFDKAMSIELRERKHDLNMKQSIDPDKREKTLGRTTKGTDTIGERK